MRCEFISSEFKVDLIGRSESKQPGMWPVCKQEPFGNEFWSTVFNANMQDMLDRQTETVASRFTEIGLAADGGTKMVPPDIVAQIQISAQWVFSSSHSSRCYSNALDWGSGNETTCGFAGVGRRGIVLWFGNALMIELEETWQAKPW